MPSLWPRMRNVVGAEEFCGPEGDGKSSRDEVNAGIIDGAHATKNERDRRRDGEMDNHARRRTLEQEMRKEGLRWRGYGDVGAGR